jgi:hypothetical protein
MRESCVGSTWSIPSVRVACLRATRKGGHNEVLALVLRSHAVRNAHGMTGRAHDPRRSLPQVWRVPRGCEAQRFKTFGRTAAPLTLVVADPGLKHVLTTSLDGAPARGPARWGPYSRFHGSMSSCLRGKCWSGRS